MLQEERRRDSARIRRRRRVGQIGRLAGQETAIRLEQRQTPHRILHRLASALHICRDPIVVGEERRQIGAQRHPRSAGERGEVDEQLRLVFQRQGQRIGEHQTPLGVGIFYLDRGALVCPNHIAGPIGIRRNRVLHRRHQHPQRDGQPSRHRQAGEAENMRRAAHVLLHQAHVAARLEIQAAAVEANALANQRHFRRVAVAPAQVDQTGRRSAGGTHRVNGVHAAARQFVAGRRLHNRAVARGKPPGGGFQVVRQHVRRWRIDEIAAQRNRRQLVQHLSIRHQQASRLALRLGLVAGVAIGAQAPSQGKPTRLVVRNPGLLHANKPIVARRQLRRQFAQALQRRASADAGDQPARRTVGIRQAHNLVGFGFEIAGIQPSARAQILRFAPSRQRYRRDHVDRVGRAAVVDDHATAPASRSAR